MKVLITGGTGFIGSKLALKYLERGDDVTVLGQENTPAEFETKQLLEAHGARIIIASVTDRERMFAVVNGMDAVYHLAAAQHEANVSDQRFWDVNVAGTKNVLEASIRTAVKRFVHGSTIGVYGANDRGPITEQTPLNPENIYGLTKLQGERLVLSFAKAIRIVILRISETYGPGDRRLLKLFRGIKRNLFCMIGNGLNLHHPIYIDDLTDALVAAAGAKDAVGKALVLAGKQVLTTNEMVQTIAKEVGARPPRLRIPLAAVWLVGQIMETVCRPLRLQPPIHRRRLDFFRKSFRFSTAEATTALGFIPKYDFVDGVRETACWYADRGYL
jgi:nucleoside-diphosphate-sugar epimerase